MIGRTNMPARTVIRSGLIVLLGLALLWFSWIFTRSVVLARLDPQRALAWPTNAARNGTAAYLLGTGKSADLSRVEMLSRQSLARSPVDAVAMRMLGLSLALQGNLTKARQVMQLGEHLSRRDLATQIWMIEDRVQAEDVKGALLHYHRAMQTNRRVRDTLLPVLAIAADDPAIAADLTPILAQRPEWWSDFLGRYAGQATSATALSTIARGLKLDPKSDIDRPRLRGILVRMVELGDVRSARGLYEAAMGVAAAPRRIVNDGGFETGGELAPFDWQLTQDGETSAERDVREGARGNYALVLAGTEGKEAARQLVSMAPGRYRFSMISGAVSAGLTAPPFVAIRCEQPNSVPLSTIALTPGAAAHRTERIVTVPEQCVAQWVQVYTGSSLGEPGDLPWIDEIELQRISD